ncbi:MAG: sigma-70 family RNA polymerase sigma factor [Acidobacteria bacterium]|nr:sigma-70 family RNA polymerase sigma factor [Acidobacteriota bacterium]
MDRHPSDAPPGGPLSNPLSEELLRRARTGDDGALDQLLARYVQRLHRWAHNRVPNWARSAADTADYVQDTVLHTLRHLGTFEPKREGALLGYLRRSLVNRVRDQFRHAARHPAPGELHDHLPDGGHSPLELAIGAEDRARYEAGLKRLRSADRKAIVASIELGYSYDQIALVLDKPTAEAARVAVRRALVRLGEEMARGAQ